MTEADSELLKAILATRSREALNQLVARHIDRVRRVIRGMVASDSTVDDLVQETFLRATRGISSFLGDSSVTTWLTRIAIHVALDHCDKQKRERLSFHNELLASAPARLNADPVERAVSAETESTIQRALLALPASLRAAIVLTAFERLSPTEAAEIEQCPIGTMYWRIHEARKRLRVQLAEYFE